MTHLDANGGRPAAPWTLAVPDGWTQTPLDDGGHVAVPDGDDAPAGPLRPSFTAELRKTDAVVTLDDLRFSHVDALVATLDRVRVLDHGVCAIGDLDAHRVLLSHRVDGVDLTLEQWAVPRRRRTAVLTAQAPTLAFAALAHDFGELVEGAQLHA